MKTYIRCIFGTLIALGLISCGGPQTEVKQDILKKSEPALSTSKESSGQEITSLAGRWRLNNNNERAIWFFDTGGRCAIRPSGLVEQKGRYQYDGKVLVINFDSGTTRYTILEKTEPKLVMMMRWGNLYNITNVLTRMQ